jgi:hypothetical protein
VELAQVVAGDLRVERVLQVVVLVEHQEADQGAGVDRAAGKEGIGRVGDSVLGETPDLGHVGYGDQGDQPAVEEDAERRCPQDGRIGGGGSAMASPPGVQHIVLKKTKKAAGLI